MYFITLMLLDNFRTINPNVKIVKDDRAKYHVQFNGAGQRRTPCQVTGVTINDTLRSFLHTDGNDITYIALPYAPGSTTDNYLEHTHITEPLSVSCTIVSPYVNGLKRILENPTPIQFYLAYDPAKDMVLEQLAKVVSALEDLSKATVDTTSIMVNGEIMPLMPLLDKDSLFLSLEAELPDNQQLYLTTNKMLAIVVHDEHGNAFTTRHFARDSELAASFTILIRTGNQ